MPATATTTPKQPTPAESHRAGHPFAGAAVECGGAGNQAYAAPATPAATSNTPTPSVRHAAAHGSDSVAFGVNVLGIALGTVYPCRPISALPGGKESRR